MGSVVLSVDGVSKTFVASDGGHVPALVGASLDVRDGEFVSVIGPSGCGKSTLFQIIGGLLASDGGSVRVDGHAINGAHRDIGMVFQEESTFPWRTVLENVVFPLELAGIAKPQREEKARRFIRLVGLEGFDQRYPDELSGGMRQRTAIARTLAAEPRILLMDEPFAALDEQTRMVLGEDLSELLERTRKTIVFVTHSLAEAVFLSDRIFVFTARPAHLKSVVAVEEPHPRQPSFMTSDKFNELRNRLYGLLRAEIREAVRQNV